MSYKKNLEQLGSYFEKKILDKRISAATDN